MGSEFFVLYVFSALLPMEWPQIGWPPDWHDEKQRRAIFTGGVVLALLFVAILLWKFTANWIRHVPAVHIARVEGTVTVDDRPAADAAVTFIPHKKPKMKGQPPASFGRTDSAGRFTLVLNGGRPGAVVGVHSVTVTNVPSLPVATPSPAAQKSDPPVVVPNRYADATSSGLTVEVKADEKNEFPLKLTSKP